MHNDVVNLSLMQLGLRGETVERVGAAMYGPCQLRLAGFPPLRRAHPEAQHVHRATHLTVARVPNGRLRRRLRPRPPHSTNK